jgi:hypothetical protein
MIAMIAPHHGEQTPRIWKRAFFDVFDPCPIHADRNLMLGFASDRASVAANTATIIDDETVIGHEFNRVTARSDGKGEF